nr:putative phage tail protein [Achromobacter insuavis]
MLPPSAMLNRQPGGVLVRVLEACGASMRAIERLAVSLVAQFDPLLADELLEDWERLYDLPDECLDAPVGKEQRRQRVNMRRLMLGGARPEYFRQMVIGLGYPDARIDEFRPFRATSKCTAAINQGGWRFAFRVNVVASANIVQATAISKCTAPLRAWGDPGLLCLLSRYKPAHTVVLVGYVDSL